MSSALDPAGTDAQHIAELFQWMAIGAAVIWVAAMAFLIYCLRAPAPRPATSQMAGQASRARRLIAGGGVVLPTLVLAGLVGNALPPIAGLVDGPAPEGALRVQVAGEQWWWRVRYPGLDGAGVDVANELRLPRGRRAHLELSSDNVIHAFWVPSIAGKIDMVPGRTTYLTLEPTRAGTFRGVCAEYCGTSHARMTFQVVVVEADEFDAWLDASGAPAKTPSSAAGQAGAAAFQASGCGSCHTVRGTPATGTIGPDLTHVAARHSPGGSPVAASSGELTAWLRSPQHLKPGALMPPFAALGEARLGALTSYLRELQ